MLLPFLLLLTLLLASGCQQSDLCPDDPGKTEALVCGCGTSDADADGNGVPDCLDAGIDLCPDDAAKTEAGTCGCGTADADADETGVPDCLDAGIDLCPDDDAKTQAGTCGCGTSDADADDNGVPDCLDAGIDLCPDDAAKTQAGTCGCGTADADADENGVPDCLDAGIDFCPDDDAKTRPGFCGCGAADADANENGVPDCLDGNACTSDTDCVDARESCRDFRCVLSPAVCTENDEPNNTVASAIALATITNGYGGLLCRGDQDFISFPVQPLKRYVVTVTITSGNTPFSGLALTLTDSNGGVESTATLTSASSVPLVGVSGAAETGRFMLAVSSGSNTRRDQWAYRITIREDEASAEADCSAVAQAGQEPNDDFATAIVLTPGVATAFSRCGTTDADFFKVDVPDLHGVEFLVDGFINAEGNLNVEVFKGPSTGELVVRGATTANSETVIAPEGSTTYFAKVLLLSATGVLQNQLYRVTARAVPRPAACDVDVGENDGVVTAPAAMTLTTTGGLVSGTSTGVRCNPQDVEHIRFAVPGNLGGTARLVFTHSEGDMALDLLDSAGTPLLTSNTSNFANSSEAIDLPQSTSEQTFIARIRLGTTNGAPIIAQTWTLEVGTFDAAQCPASEPSADNTFVTARCVGDFTPEAGATVCPAQRLPAPLTGNLGGCQATPTDVNAGCFLTCGHSDVDVYRIGEIEADRTVSVQLAFDPSAGKMNFQIGRVSSPTSTTLSVVTTQTDVDNDGLITANFVTTGTRREHAITVRPEGTLGHEGQVYALSVFISPACIADGNEPNANASAATILEQDINDADVVVAGSLCSADIDVYRLALARNQTIEVRLAQLRGARLTMGTQPATSTSVPTPVIPSATVTANENGDGVLRFTAPNTSMFFLTLDRGTFDAGFGPYEMTLDFTPPPN